MAQRGIAQTSGWQVCQLYDPACDVHVRCEGSLELLALRRERMPSPSTYRVLRMTADAHDAWLLEQDSARVTFQRTEGIR